MTIINTVADFHKWLGKNQLIEIDSDGRIPQGYVRATRLVNGVRSTARVARDTYMQAVLC